MKYIHLGWFGLVINARYTEVLDFVVGFTTLDLAGDDGIPVGRWPWKRESDAPPPDIIEPLAAAEEAALPALPAVEAPPAETPVAEVPAAETPEVAAPPPPPVKESTPKKTPPPQRNISFW